jgi:hypothetical protein
LEESLRTHLTKTAVTGVIAIAFFSQIAGAQAPQQAPLAIPNPHYEVIPLEITVNKPAD